jgi:oligopeptide transport system substrate-binding protein
MRCNLDKVRLGVFFLVLSLLVSSCGTSAKGKYYGKTVAPKDGILRYVTGSEPLSLDPAVGNGQPEARIYLSLFEGLVEYDPKDNSPIPAIAESWQVSKDGTEYLFNLRKNAKFSDGTPITAKDFVYSFRRGLSPELATVNANLAYFIKYSEAYNSGQVFVKDSSGKFLLKSDAEPQTESSEATSSPDSSRKSIGAETEFDKIINQPERLTVKGSEKDRAKLFEKDPKLKELLEGKEFVPVKAEDIGVEAVDDYTFRIKLYQPAPYFLGLLAHQLFRVVPQHTIEKFGKAWVRPENIISSGAFKVLTHKPYDKLVVTKNENYWDAANVKLNGIQFFPLEEQTTMMNLYQAGEVDAIYNHSVPSPWLKNILPFYKDEYMNHPEVTTEFYVINVKKAPMDNVKVRQAFALAIDRVAFAKLLVTKKPLVDFTPEGIFPKYEEARKIVQDKRLKELKMNEDDWKKRVFDPERARKVLQEAGYPVEGAEGSFNCPKFPLDHVSITYNTAESNKVTAEYIQDQWKRNLGITVPLKNMEFKTFLPMINKVEYEGFARRGWVGDYMDPFTFLGLFYTESNDGATGWTDKKFDQLLSKANNTVDPQERFTLLAEAEFYMMEQQLVIPLNTAATNWIKKPYLKGVYPNPGTLHAWKFAYIEEDSAKWDKDVDNIMKQQDPIVEDQLAKLVASQKQFEEKMKQTAATTETSKQ